MRKLTLDLDAIEVEAFDTGPAQGGGTVMGHATQYEVCRQFPGTDSDQHIGCEPGFTNDENTCQQYTCASCFQTECPEFCNPSAWNTGLMTCIGTCIC